jgi:hypothetical protein
MSGADTSAQIPADRALRRALGNVVEIVRVLSRIRQLVVHHGQLIVGRLLQAAGGIHNAGKGRRGPTRAAHRTPTAFEVDNGATEIRRNIGISTLLADDAFNAVLVSGPFLVRTDVAATAALHFALKIAGL